MFLNKIINQITFLCKSNFILSLILFSTIITIESKAKDFDFEKVSLGMAFQYSIPKGDLGAFWGNSLGIGPTIQYQLSNNFSFEGSLFFSHLKPLDNDNKLNLPNIIMLNMPAGIKYYINPTSSQTQFFIINFHIGIENNTFIYTGEGSELVRENPVESEFGVFISTGIDLFLTERFSTELFAIVQNIFSLPENTRIYSFGIKLFYK
jgi:hypothetical protein